jgi:putative nucleotidyltransferase with HDIG domain
MKEKKSELIDVSQLRTGMFVELELAWLSHPFPTGSFMISSSKQIEIIRSLGLERVRYVPRKSDLPALSEGSESMALSVDSKEQEAADPFAKKRAAAKEALGRQDRVEFLEAQQRNLLECERRFGMAAQGYMSIVESLPDQPKTAGQQCRAFINNFVNEMTCNGETAIRLLSEGASDRAAVHPVNVVIMTLLLGKAMGLNQNDMVDLGLAALLHDIGKLALPDRVRSHEEGTMSATEYRVYQEHVKLGVAQARRMALSESVQTTIAQHHENVDGSGFPGKLKGDQLTRLAKILVLVNRYENLCNPSRQASALTPHEALALLFTQYRTRFDSVVLSAFIRMLGVYPPGSLVQLTDERYALVVSVNSSRTLKPRLIVYEPSVPRHEALILDLEKTPEQGIRRSIKPANLSPDAMAYLLPRQRLCYFFEKNAAHCPQAV